QWLRATAAFARLGDMQREIRALRKEVQRLVAADVAADAAAERGRPEPSGRPLPVIEACLPASLASGPEKIGEPPAKCGS
ncbi:MAG: hypothetical protein ACRD2D_12415, partial [Terriglobales bacterium]